MKSAPTVADAVLRETFRPHHNMANNTKRTMPELRSAITSAHKFILDPCSLLFFVAFSIVKFFFAPRR